MAAKKDILKPDTVETILGFPQQKTDWQKTKVQMNLETENLKKQELHAWVETTRNIVKLEKEDELEMSALKKLVHAGKNQENVDVQVVDRMKDAYLKTLQDKMNKVKSMTDSAPDL